MGTMGIFSRKTGLHAEVITFFRLSIGALFLLGLVFISQNHRLLFKRPGWPVLLNGLMLAGFIIFYVQSMYYTTMANAIMVLYLAPLAASVAAHFLLGEKLTRQSITLICLALLGFAMMMEFRVDLSFGSNQTIGIGYALLGLFCYTSFILINRIVDSTVHVYTRTFYLLLSGALVTLPFMISDIFQVQWQHIPWLIGAGLIPGFLGALFAVIALARLPAATFGTLAYFEPIFVVLLGWLVFNEHLSLLQLAGCGLILASGGLSGYLAATKQPTCSR
jgi:drug/metabolite transporter (DMT)-like permease